MPLDLLCEAPLYDREAKEDLKEREDDKEKIKMPEDLNAVLLKLLESPNICSKEWIYQQYDHEVQIRTVIKPGKDAAVLKIDEIYPMGIALTTDCNSRYCKLNPYVGAVNAVAEAVRNLATVGAEPLAMLDNLNFGNPERPERFWQLAECIRGLADAAEFFDIPVVGGNVSLYNETVIEGKEFPINPTPAIFVLGKVEDVEKLPGVLDNKIREGDILIITNETKDEMGGSEYYKVIHNTEDGRVPRVDLEKEKKIYAEVREVVKEGLVSEAVDCSRGGLAVALAKMAILNNIGLDVDLTDYNKNNLREDILLFSETSGRLILAVREDNKDKVLSKLSNAYVIGKVGGNRLKIKINGKEIIDLDVNEMKKRYYEAFPKMMGEL